MGTRCESHRKEGLLSTPTNQKKKNYKYNTTTYSNKLLYTYSLLTDLESIVLIMVTFYRASRSIYSTAKESK